MIASPLIAALIGAGLGIGLLTVAAAWHGMLATPRWLRARTADVDRVVARSGLALGGAAVMRWQTGWVAASIGAGLLGWCTPAIVGERDRRRSQMVRTEAVAIWAEMLRDLLVSNAGMREAISRSARVAPDAIRAEVQALDVRAQRGHLRLALRRFADELASPVADTVVLAILLAERRAVADLGAMLADVAASTRETVAMQRRINATRARTYRTSQLIAGVVIGAVALLMLTNREYMEPFGDTVGQIVLLVVLGIVVAAVMSMLRLSRPMQPARLLRVGNDRRTPS